MFRSFDPDWPPVDPPSPDPGPRPGGVRLDETQQKRLMQAIGLNMLLLLVAPIGGATVIGGLLAWWG
ncbi:hypothetical protein [Blastomonas fulva]|uniref:hypothetical protein n=1 Tax=Blastomonas fulva TaxID=1550728 RepID=UPI0025A35D61|nr:hypothetical protein [Blastomonas fulva]MDM7967820.1 hypothetical protein [Blastomonas fulva]